MSRQAGTARQEPGGNMFGRGSTVFPALAGWSSLGTMPTPLIRAGRGGGGGGGLSDGAETKDRSRQG